LVHKFFAGFDCSLLLVLPIIFALWEECVQEIEGDHGEDELAELSTDTDWLLRSIYCKFKVRVQVLEKVDAWINGPEAAFLGVTYNCIKVLVGDEGVLSCLPSSSPFLQLFALLIEFDWVDSIILCLLLFFDSFSTEALFTANFDFSLQVGDQANVVMERVIDHWISEKRLHIELRIDFWILIWEMLPYRNVQISVSLSKWIFKFDGNANVLCEFG
jgi:hypothetical protein